MPNTNAFRWFKDTFSAQIEAAIAGAPRLDSTITEQRANSLFHA